MTEKGLNDMNTPMKRFLFGAIAAFAAFTASADVIYWMVAGTEDITNDNAPLAFYYATISVDGGATHLNMVEWQGVEAVSTGFYKLYSNEGDSTSTGPGYSGSFNSASVSSFLVELWNENDQRVGWQTYDQAEVMESIWKDGDDTSRDLSGVAQFRVTGVIPEPSSGLMLLLGGMLLALRRRKA